VGEVSVVDYPVVIVGLLRELEYREGAVWPCQRRVIEMPVAVGETRKPAGPEASRRPTPAPVVQIRLEPRRIRFVYKAAGGVLTAAILLHLAISAFSARIRPAAMPKLVIQR
jgi:hypothetical protein